jgi:hypothetical protein
MLMANWMAKKIHNALENFQLFESFSNILAPEKKI